MKLGGIYMEYKELLPYNNLEIQTKELTSLGINNKVINKLIDEGILTRVRRGFYKVTIKNKADKKMMRYYLNNNLYQEFIDYYNQVDKDYDTYYFKFLYDIISENYSSAYTSLSNCIELNTSDKNKHSLYAYVLLLGELVNLSEEKLNDIRLKIYDEKEDATHLFLEYLVRKDYDKVTSILRANRGKIKGLELDVLRKLSNKAGNIYQRKNSKELEEYNKLYKSLLETVMNNDYDSAYYYYGKLVNYANLNDIKDARLQVVGDLFNCFSFILENQEITLETYMTNFTYHKDPINNFYDALSKNDYINALKIITEYNMNNDNDDFRMYQVLLERIYNFLNIRNIIASHNQRRNTISLTSLIKDKKYEEALSLTSRSNMDENNKNIVTSLLEGIIALDDNSLFKNE
jgi:hypothetical protein